MEEFSIAATIVTLILFIHTVSSHVIEIKQITYLHESAVSIGLGVIVALILKAIDGTTVEFSHSIFFNMILPPIIFAGGFNLRKTLFFENFGLISFYGIIGTVLSFFVIASTSLLLIQSDLFFEGKDISTSDMLLFAAVLSATDTVAALSLVKESLYPQLNSVLFGEGIVNDAISIVIFRSIKNYVVEANTSFSSSTFFLILLDFIKLLVFSILVGLIIGLLISLLFKRFNSFSNFPFRETSIIFLAGYFSYILAEMISLSGIISLFSSGVVMGHYAFLNISEESQKGTHLAFETVGYLAEAFVFAYLGISLTNISYADMEIGFSLCMMGIICFARCFSVYSLPCLELLFKKESKLTRHQLQMVWYSGTIRGAIAFGLTLMIESENLNVLLSIVILIILFSTVVLGSLLQIYGKWIGLQPERNDFFDVYMNSNFSKKVQSISDYGEIGYYNKDLQNKLRVDLQASSPVKIKSGYLNNSHRSTGSGSNMKEKLKQLEQQYVQPIFSKKSEEKVQSIDLQEYQANVDKLSHYDQF